jgi:hypothetical protein
MTSTRAETDLTRRREGKALLTVVFLSVLVQGAIEDIAAT